MVKLISASKTHAYTRLEPINTEQKTSEKTELDVFEIKNQSSFNIAKNLPKKAFNHVLKQVGFGNFNNTSTQAQLRFPYSTGLGFQMDKTHFSTQTQDGTEPEEWSQIKGVLEVNAGYFQSFPLLTHPNCSTQVQGGFSGNALFYYEIIQKKDEKEDFLLPFDATSALRMKAGEEFSLFGEGQITLHGGFYQTAGQNTGLVTLGAALSLDASIGTGYRYHLNIKKTAEPDEVCITLDRVKMETYGGGAELAVGVVSSSSVLSPPIGNGFLQFTFQTGAQSSLGSLINFYATLKGDLRLIKKNEENHLFTCKLNLACPNAQKAFLAMLRLDPAFVCHLLQTNQEGISLRYKNKEKSTKSMKASLSLFGQGLYALSKTYKKSKGETRDFDQQIEHYQTKTYEMSRRSCVSGIQKRHIQLKWIQSPLGEYQWTLKVSLEDKKYRLKPKQLEVWTRFLNHLAGEEVKPSQPIYLLGGFKSLFSNQDDLGLNMDFYISHAGMQELSQSEETSIRDMYLKARGLLEPEMLLIDKKEALDLLWQWVDLVLDVKNKSFKREKRLLYLNQQYETITGGDLHQDARIYIEATQLAKALKKSYHCEKSLFHVLQKTLSGKKIKSLALILSLQKLISKDNWVVSQLKLKNKNEIYSLG